MSTAIILAVIIAICFFAVKKYIKNLKHGCCGAGGDSEKRQTPALNTSEYKYHYTIKISGMKCSGCAIKIENAFIRQGMAAQVNHKTGIAEIFAGEPVSELIIRQTIIGLGYSVDEEKIPAHQ